MALIGVGCAPMLMSSLYIFGRTERPERFAALSSAMVGLGNLGNLAAATPLALAATAFGWRWSMAGVGLAMGLAAPSHPAAAPRSPGPRPHRRGVGRRSSATSSPSSASRPLVHLAAPSRRLRDDRDGARPLGRALPRCGPWARRHRPRQCGLRHVDRHGFGALTCGPRRALARRREAPGRDRQCRDGAPASHARPSAGARRGPATVLLVLIGYFGLTYSLMLSHGRQFIPDHLLGRGVTVLNFLAIGGAGLCRRSPAAGSTARSRPALARQRLRHDASLDGDHAPRRDAAVPARPERPAQRKAGSAPARSGRRATAPRMPCCAAA